MTIIKEWIFVERLPAAFFAPIPVLLGGRTDSGISSLMEKDRPGRCVVPQVARVSPADSRNLVEGGENAQTPGKVGKLFLAVVGGAFAVAAAEGLGLVG